MQLCTTDTWIYLLPLLVFTRKIVVMNFRILYFNFLHLTLLLLISKREDFEYTAENLDLFI